MERLKFRVEFLTPAFLGSADQSAQWRTPPFKALLRQWWRVAQAAEYGYDHERLRETEGMLFGHVFLKASRRTSEALMPSDRRFHDAEAVTWASKSMVQIRLRSWEKGKTSINPNGAWPEGKPTTVSTCEGNRRAQVRADVYLGYGPVHAPTRQRNNVVGLEHPPAIGVGENAIFELIFPSDQIKFEPLMTALRLIQAFGTIGSRSRNGWGSIQLRSDGDRNLPVGETMLTELDWMKRVLRPWEDCLQLSWPHAIGARNKKPLVWIGRTKHQNWLKAIEELAQIKVAMRAAAKKLRGPGLSGVVLLGYPAGGAQQVRTLPKNARWASQFRFKVIADATGGVRALAVHVPCTVPEDLRTHMDTRQREWLSAHERDVISTVHRVLDERMSSLPEGRNDG